MRTSAVYLLVIGILAGAVVVLKDSFAQTGPGNEPAGKLVAVCNVTEILKNYERPRDFADKATERRRAIDAENKKRQEAILEIGRELAQLKEGSTEYENRWKERRRLEVERKGWVQFQTASLQRDHFKVGKETYEDMLKMVETVAKEQGYHLVLYHEGGALQSQNLTELLAEMASRRVLYAHSSVELTRTVLSRLNQAYGAKGAK